MRGMGKNKTNWLLTAILIVAFQYLAFTFVIPMMTGLEVLTIEYIQENSWIIGVTAVISIVLAYITAYIIKNQFYGAGIRAGRSFR